MDTRAPVPRFDDDLGVFLGDLRTWAFASQSQAARHFGVTHSTVSRYENSHLTPPMGYLAALVQLVAARLDDGGPQAAAHRSALLAEANQAVRTAYPGERLFRDWDDLSRLAAVHVTRPAPPAPPAPLAPLAPLPQIDWGEAPEIHTFVGREAELAQLTAWVRDERCRLVAILGMGGVGKTTLATRLVEEVQAEFEFVIWRSLRSAPRLADTLQEFWSVLGRHTGDAQPQPFEVDAVHLLRHLREHRCLIVLDNLESIMYDGAAAGRFRPGYEDYGESLRAIAAGRHRSCLLITSREQPDELSRWTGAGGPVRILHLHGMDVDTATRMLAGYPLRSSSTGLPALIAAYAGNPLALQLAADLVTEVYGGDVDALLASSSRMVTGVRRLLDEQLARLTPLETEILYSLAAACEPVNLQTLAAGLVPPPAGAALADAVHSLLRRSLVERSGENFLLQAVVAEYATLQLTTRMAAELVAGDVMLAERVALLQAVATEDVRQTQVRLLLAPVAEQLAAALSQGELRARFEDLVAHLRTRAGPAKSYGAGNLLNLLLHLGYELNGADFSGLAIRHAYLREATLHDVDFSHADLTGSVFRTTFAGVNAIALSPDGRLLAVATGQEVRIWEVATSQIVTILAGHRDLVWDVAFDPTGEMLATGSADRTVRLWRLATGAVVRAWLGHAGWVWAVAISGDGAWLASGSEDCTVRVWSLATGALAGVLDAADGPVRSVAFNPQSSLLAAGSADGHAYLWQLPELEPSRRVGQPGDALMAVAFDPTGDLLATGGAGQVVRVWRVATGELAHTWHGHTDAIADVAISADGRMVASASYDRTVGLWSLDPQLAHRIFHGHSQAVRSLAFAAGGVHLVTGSYDQSVRLWDLHTGHLQHLFQGHTFEVKAIAFSPDGGYVASGNADRLVRVWRRASGELVHTLAGHNRWVAAVAFHPAGDRLATGSYDRSVRIWDLTSGKPLLTLPDHGGWVWCLAYSPDGEFLAASGAGRVIHLWQVETGRAVHTLAGHEQGVWSLAFSPDGASLASGGDDCTVRLWDRRTGAAVRVLPGHRGRVAALAFSGNGSLLASAGCDGQVHVWAVGSGQLVNTFAHTDSEVCALAFSPEDTLLYCSTDAELLLAWNLGTGELIDAQPRAGDAATALSFDADGQRLASGRLDGVIDVWHVPDGASDGRLRIVRPYEGMNITGARGLSAAQVATLQALGAVSA